MTDSGCENDFFVFLFQLLSKQADNGHITRSQKKADLEELNVMFQR